MTKTENQKCEKLMIEAICSVEESDMLLAEMRVQEDTIDYEITLRRAEQKYGYALGINQALVSLGFKHKKMEKLQKLL